METPTIETSRMVLRPLAISDAGAIFTNWAADPEVTKFLRFNPHQSIDVTREWLDREVENLASDESYQWLFLHKPSNEVIGSGGFSYNQEHKMFEVGYVLMKQYWNQGLTTEAVKAIVDFAVTGLNQSELFAIHAKGNPASGKVLEKAGFAYVADGQYESFDGTRVYESKGYIYRA